MDSFEEGDENNTIALQVPQSPMSTALISAAGHDMSLAISRDNSYNQLSNQLACPDNRRTNDELTVAEFSTVSRRQSVTFSTNIRRQSVNLLAQRRMLMDMLQGRRSSKSSARASEDHASSSHRSSDKDWAARNTNRRLGDDAITTVLSALYAKLIVVLGIAFPVTDILSSNRHPSFYQGFYLYLYVVSVAFVVFMYTAHLRTRALFTMIDKFQDDKKDPIIKKPVAHYGSFYLRVGAVAFGIGSMVYSGLEFGQYFELKGEPGCQNVLIALTPAARTILSIVQMQFIFLNTKEFEMDRHKVIARFGLMHMVATNLCEWLYVLVEETKHEIIHLNHINNDFHLLGHNSTVSGVHAVVRRATATQIIVECRRTNIMGSLVQNASPFLFPCTIEYSLICAVILFEMWKKIRNVEATRKNIRKISNVNKSAYHFSVDCSRAHRGMFAGILIIVLTIISLIMFYVLSAVPAYHNKATLEVTLTEIIVYAITAAAVLLAYLKMRDIRFVQHPGIPLDCTLLLLAQSGVFIYSIFSIIGTAFAIQLDTDVEATDGGAEAIVAEVFCLLQTCAQTMFILNAWYRRCKSARQTRDKPGRETITFLLVANMALWFINTLVKNRAMFRPTHLRFFGAWAWTIITHVSMPLAIFYRFHSTICLFEIWKTTYKVRHEPSVSYK